MINPQDFPAIQRLRGSDWDTLKSEYIKSVESGGGSQEQAARKMQTCIEDRDVVDYASYREAILRIFSADYFNLDAKVEGNIAETSKGGYAFTAKWYTFIVTQKTQKKPTGLEESQKCKIAIKAPGSRTLTSDIDTSILTTFTGENSFFERAEARVKDKGPDFEGRVTNAVIDSFYKITEELFQMTSSSHRDSNAYTDAIAKDEENYPKFLHDEENNPSIQGERLFSEEEFTTLFKEYKHKKHIQEIAASLFSLRCSLETEEWEAFKKLVKEKLSEILRSEFKKKQGREIHISSCHQDYDNIFQEVENLHNDHLAALQFKVQELNLLNPPPVREEDIPVVALNRLYVEHLEECTTCHGQILNFKIEKQTLIKELSENKQKLNEELGALNTLDPKSTHLSIQKLIQEMQISSALLEENCSNLKKSLRKNIIETAQLQVKHQYSQILANTFANEAYVCRSAVYHVVHGQSGTKDLPISQQTLLGSALQQVGFKLLHTRELAKKKFTSEEIAYYTAKYGQRLFNLIFSGYSAEFKPSIIANLVKGKKGEGYPKFTYLKSKQLRHNSYGTFGEEELILLNDQAKIIQHIKKNSEIPDAEKPKKMVELFGSESQKKFNFEQEKKLYLSISAKLIGLVCASRLKNKEYLWGQNRHIRLLNKAKIKEEIETSSPAPLSTPETLLASKITGSTKEEPSKDKEGRVTDIDRQLGEHAKCLVIAGKEAKATGAVQQAHSRSGVGAGLPEAIARSLITGVYGNNPK
ncbi:hypothetical protein [Candidatus Protochlamydia amoebophila]|uniref:hypothetical protein n=1 Tax=Candidatus Protochlamydia amoebophila TaxID=362787 RepID=UPI001BC92FFE|nr:hypothetical protein [Candidatus Protochlamydia amoebophila]